MTKTFLGFDSIFELSDPFNRKAFRGGWENTSEDVYKLSRAESKPKQPIIVPWAMGGIKTYDFIWTGMAVPAIVHDRVIDLLTSNNFTGWETYKVKIIGKDRIEIPGYHGLAINGRCGLVDLEKSEIVLREYPGGWFPKFKGQFFRPDTWDGSDLFMQMPDIQRGGSVTYYLTHEVYNAFKKAKINNVKFECLSETEEDTNNYEIGLQHRLPANFRSRIAEAYRFAGVQVPKRYANFV